MQFLKTLFWVVAAVVLVLFASANWNTPQNGAGMVTIQLWGGLQADVKLPVLVAAAFLIGFLPTFILYRARLWSLKRRLDGQPAVHVVNAPGTPVRNAPPAPPAKTDRTATDSKAWPAE